MKINKLFALALAVLFVISMLAGCGAKSEAMDAPAADAPAADAPAQAPGDYLSDDLSTSSDAGQAAMPENQKIIVTKNLQAQTEDMELILGKVNAKIAELGGYVEAQDVYNGSAYHSYRYRYAHLTIRIPADKLNQFVSLVSENANVVSESTSTENITLSYIAVESRIAALEAERDRLLELMAKAEDLNDLLKIEARLTDVVADLETVNAQLRLYDNKVTYSTVYLDIEEVKEYTPVEEEPETVWERISSGFSKSLKNVGEGLVDFFVGFIVALPYLVPWAVIIGAVIALVITTKRRKARKRAEALAKAMKNLDEQKPE